MAGRGVRGKATTPSVSPLHSWAPEIVYLIPGYDARCPSVGTVPVVETALVEGTDRRVYAVSVPCGDDRP